MIFINNKYTGWYYGIINNARNRNIEGYTEKHHIIPRSLGGSNKKDNLVILTAKEHFVCHLLLIKITESKSKKKMSRALWLMAKGTGKRYRPSSRLYEIARKNFVQSQIGHINYLKCQTQDSINKISSTMKKVISELSAEEKFQRTKNSWSSPESWTIERKKKISVALTGKILSIETKRKMSKSCIFLCPKGTKYFYFSLKEGCVTHSFNYGSVKNSIFANKPYKGWTIYYDEKT